MSYRCNIDKFIFNEKISLCPNCFSRIIADDNVSNAELLKEGFQYAPINLGETITETVPTASSDDSELENNDFFDKIRDFQKSIDNASGDVSQPKNEPIKPIPRFEPTPNTASNMPKPSSSNTTTPGGYFAQNPQNNMTTHSTTNVPTPLHSDSATTVAVPSVNRNPNSNNITGVTTTGNRSNSYIQKRQERELRRILQRQRVNDFFDHFDWHLFFRITFILLIIFLIALLVINIDLVLDFIMGLFFKILPYILLFAFFVYLIKRLFKGE